MKKSVGNAWILRIVSGLLMLAIFLGALGKLQMAQAELGASPYSRTYIYPHEVSMTDWMKRIPDEALISEINIPGTHDSCTARMNHGISDWYAQCQDWTIAEQLQHGLRVFDVRIAGTEKIKYDPWWKLEITHGNWRCANKNGDILKLEEVIGQCDEFLTKHPKETVILQIAVDGSGDDKKYGRQMQKRMLEDCNLLNENEFKLYNVPIVYYTNQSADTKQSRIPRLEDVRGKIVIVSDDDSIADGHKNAVDSYEMHYEEDNKGTRIALITLFAAGGAWANPFYWATWGAYLEQNTEIKYKYLARFLNDSRKTQQDYTNGHGKRPGFWGNEGYRNKDGSYGEPAIKISGTNVNTAGKCGPCSPKISDYSDRIIEWMKNQPWENGIRYGWITMDFPVDELTRQIIATNEIETTEVQVDISCTEMNDIYEQLTIGGKAYRGDGRSTVLKAYLHLLPEIAEQLEEGSLDIGIGPKCSIWSMEHPVTVNFVHLGENHWRCDVYPEIKVTLKWDYAEPPTIDILKNKFLTAKYADGTECAISPADIRIEKNAGDETVLYLHLLPYDNTHGEINIDINPSGGAAAYRYDQTADKQKEGLLSWIFTLHNGGDFVNLKGTVIFDDNNDEAGLRGKEYPIHLIATGTKSGAVSGEGSEDPIIFEERLFFDCANTSWERKYLPVKYGEYDLTWDLLDDPINYFTGWSRYTITHEKNGNQFTSTFRLRLHPLSDIEIKWENENGDLSYRPSSLDIYAFRKSSSSFLWSTKVTAAEQWRHVSTRILNDDNKDDWTASIWNLPATYKYEGPFLRDDGKGVTFVCTRQNNITIRSNVYWYDGEPITTNHPTVTIALSNGKKTVTTRTAGGNKRQQDTIDFGLRDSTDESGNPYYYSIAINGEAPSGYTATIDGFDITFIRTATLRGDFRWYDSASSVQIERPSWIKEAPPVTLLERINAYGQEWKVNDTEPTVDGNSFDFGTVAYGTISDDDPEARMDYQLSVDISKIPGAASAAITKPAPIGAYKYRYAGVVKIVMEPAMACVPFTISVEDEGFHPEKTFTVTLADSKGTVVATRECTVKQNVSLAPFQFEFEKKSLADEDYTLFMEPVVDDGRWTEDPGVKSLTLSVRYNEETDTIEAKPKGEAPAFRVTYEHKYEPITVQGKFNVTVLNENPNASVPAVDFRFTPYVNGSAQAERTAKGGESILISETVSQPSEIVLTMEQAIFDSIYWELDDVSRSVRVKVDSNENGELVAEYAGGNENTFRNVFLSDEMKVDGFVIWDEMLGSDTVKSNCRPSKVTLELTPFYTEEMLTTAGQSEDDIPILKSLNVDVTDEDVQPFDFGWQKRVDDNGNWVQYTVREQPFAYYKITNGYEGYSVLNQLTGEAVHAAGTVEWLGETDESFRPKEVTVNLFRQYKGAEAEKIGTKTVKPDTVGVWSYDFGAYPVEDVDGNTITYYVEEEPVTGYTTHINGFTVKNTKFFYLITAGDGQTYILKSGQNATFICNGPFEKFQYLTVDGVKVNPKQYTAVSGSTVLTLKNDWLDGLTVAEHSIRFHYSDGISNEGTFRIVKVPRTGDASMPWLYAVLMLCSAGTLIGFVHFRKKPGKKTV